MTVPVSALQGIAPSAIIELFELQLNVAQHGINETHYFHAGTNEINNGDVIWVGNTYQKFPIEVDGFKYSGQGQLPRPTLRISNLLGTITGLLLTLPSGLEGAKVTRIRTLARYLDAANFPSPGFLLLENESKLLLEDGSAFLLGPVNATADPTAQCPSEIFYIDRKAAENQNVVEFELAAAFDLAGVRLPKRQCVGNICQWIYKGTECGYAGNAFFNANDLPVDSASFDVCGKRLSSCELRFAQIRRIASVTSGSNILALQIATAFNTGDSVTGFGLPTGTTVVSYSGNTVTVSANATASSTVSKNGTLQLAPDLANGTSKYNKINFANVTNLSVGMIVTGTYLAPNTQITAISGSTVTLGTPADATQFNVAQSTYTSVKYTGPLLNTVYFVSSTSPNIALNALVTSIFFTAAQNAKVTGITSVTGNTAAYVSGGVSYPSTVGVALKAVKVATTSATTAATFGGGDSWTFYTTSAPVSATYTFTSANTYTFRQSLPIPYGSFPGIGGFTA